MKHSADSLAPPGIQLATVRAAAMLWARSIILSGGDRVQEDANIRPEPKSRTSRSSSVGASPNITLRKRYCQSRHDSRSVRPPFGCFKCMLTAAAFSLNQTVGQFLAWPSLMN